MNRNPRTSLSPPVLRYPHPVPSPRYEQEPAHLSVPTTELAGDAAIAAYAAAPAAPAAAVAAVAGVAVAGVAVAGAAVHRGQSVLLY